MNLTKKLWNDFAKRLKKNKDIMISIEGTGKEGRSVTAIELQKLAEKQLQEEAKSK